MKMFFWSFVKCAANLKKNMFLLISVSVIGVGKSASELFLLTLVWMVAALPRFILLVFADDVVSDLEEICTIQNVGE